MKLIITPTEATQLYIALETLTNELLRLANTPRGLNLDREAFKVLQGALDVLEQLKSEP